MSCQARNNSQGRQIIDEDKSSRSNRSFSMVKIRSQRQKPHGNVTKLLRNTAQVFIIESPNAVKSGNLPNLCEKRTLSENHVPGDGLGEWHERGANEEICVGHVGELLFFVTRFLICRLEYYSVFERSEALGCLSCRTRTMVGIGTMSFDRSSASESERNTMRDEALPFMSHHDPQ
jgi:hypothetical protein